MDFGAFLNDLRRRSAYQDQIVHARFLPGRAARFGTLGRALHPDLKTWLDANAIERFYTHQVAAVEAIRRGEHVAVVTSTASGKTLCYNLPVLDALLADP
jgi:DEAD/DEAH box helicase domain-containing protein